MAWTIPSPATIADRVSTGFEAAFTGIDARSERCVAAVLARVTGLALYDPYLYQRSLADELLPDTATDWLPRHAAIWGVPRIAASAAAGEVVFSGTAGTALPAGLSLVAAGGALYTTDAAATLGSTGSAAVSVTASATGTAGNAAAGTVLSLVSPVAGLASQSATGASSGLTAGAAIEDEDSWRARIVQRVRDGGAAGKATDYENWARAAGGLGKVRVVSSWIGAGSVGVICGMAGDRVPTSTELARITAAIAAERPVTARVVVLGVTLLPVPIALSVSPDTVAVRAAIETAIALHFAADAAIGTTLALSRLSEAISAAAGEYSHRIALPAADVVPGAAELPVPGSITWVSA